MPKLTRYQDWPSRLQAHCMERLTSQFIWGANDCCTFACDGILAMTGTDVAALYRGRYTSEASMQGYIETLGQHSLQDIVQAVTQEYEMPSVSIRQANRGDVVLFSGPQGPTLGLLVDNGVATVSPKGLIFKPLAEFLNATDDVSVWKVG